MTAITSDRPPGVPVTDPGEIPAAGWMWALTDAGWRLCLVGRRTPFGAHVTYTDEVETGTATWLGLTRHRFVPLHRIRNHGRRPARKDTR